MAEVKYRKLTAQPGHYGIFDRNYMLGTVTEDDLRHTLALCNKDLSSGLSLGEYGQKLVKLRASILDALEVV